MMTKYGILTTDSCSDFEKTAKAAYYDEEGFEVADEKNKHKLKKPAKVEDFKPQDEE